MDIALYKKYENVITEFLKYKNDKIHLINNSFYIMQKNPFTQNYDRLIAITNLSPSMLLNEINEVVTIFNKKTENSNDSENNKLYSELEFKKFTTINGRELLLELKLNYANIRQLKSYSLIKDLQQENKKLKDQLTIVLD